MIGYKASYSGKCGSLTYEIGKTYTFNGKLEMCQQGLHFCKNPKDVLNYYDIDNPEFQLFRIKVLGGVIDAGDKSVTDKIKILEIIPKSEYTDLLDREYDKNGNLIDIDGEHKDRREADKVCDLNYEERKEMHTKYSI